MRGPRGRRALESRRTTGVPAVGRTVIHLAKASIHLKIWGCLHSLLIFPPRSPSPFLPVPLPFPISFPFPGSPPPIPATGCGERYNLPHWSLGRSPTRQMIWCPSWPKVAALVPTVFVDFNKNKLHVRHKHKMANTVRILMHFIEIIDIIMQNRTHTKFSAAANNFFWLWPEFWKFQWLWQCVTYY